MSINPVRDPFRNHENRFCALNSKHCAGQIVTHLLLKCSCQITCLIPSSHAVNSLSVAFLQLDYMSKVIEALQEVKLPHFWPLLALDLPLCMLHNFI